MKPANLYNLYTFCGKYVNGPPSRSGPGGGDPLELLQSCVKKGEEGGGGRAER